jgi:Glycosyl transferase family 2
MNTRPDITVTVNFHREGAYVLPALASMRDMVDTARHTGLVVEAQAVLDRPDDLTRDLVAARGSWLSTVEEISVGDVGVARNAGTASASGTFLAFLDGDDLWGDDWLLLAHKAATAPGAPDIAIWHPESLYYFYESDFNHHSIDETPHSHAQSFHMMHGTNEEAGFDSNALFLNNAWTANAFTRREVHLRHPYLAADRHRGLGCEDWSWNIATLWSGLPHRVVADTVHLIRVKEAGSLGTRNAAEGLLPYLPHTARPLLKRD